VRDLDLTGLRARWHPVFRRKAPDHLPRHLLYRMIAYRLQAERLGDLDRDTAHFLDRVARDGNKLQAARSCHRRHGLQRAEPRDLGPFSTTVRVASPLGLPLRSFSKRRCAGGCTGTVADRPITKAIATSNAIATTSRKPPVYGSVERSERNVRQSAAA
jgi:hypothetical protein